MIGDMDQDDQRSLPERAWPGTPWVEREHEGGGDIESGERWRTFQGPELFAPGIVEEADLEPLEGPLDDPWVRGWHAGFVDGKREAKHRLAMARLDAQHQRRAIVLELTIVVAVIVLVLAIVLST